MSSAYCVAFIIYTSVFMLSSHYLLYFTAVRIMYIGRKIPQDPKSWKDEINGDTENLWLNLSTGEDEMMMMMMMVMMMVMMMMMMIMMMVVVIALLLLLMIIMVLVLEIN